MLCFRRRHAYVSESSLLVVSSLVPFVRGSSATTDSASKAAEEAVGVLRSSGKSLAMHIVAARPSFLDEASVPEGALEKEKNLLLEQAKESGKDPKFLGKMVEGRCVSVSVCVGLRLCVCLVMGWCMGVQIWLDVARVLWLLLLWLVAFSGFRQCERWDTHFAPF